MKEEDAGTEARLKLLWTMIQRAVVGIPGASCEYFLYTTATHLKHGEGGAGP